MLAFGFVVPWPTAYEIQTDNGGGFRAEGASPVASQWTRWNWAYDPKPAASARAASVASAVQSTRCGAPEGTTIRPGAAYGLR